MLITTDPEPPYVKPLTDTLELQKIIVPSVDELLTTEYEHFPFNKTFEQARDEPLVSLHTSGTTGLPKPIIYTHDFAASYTRMIQLEPPSGFETFEREYQGTRVFVLLPPFHVSVASVLNGSLLLSKWNRLLI